MLESWTTLAYLAACTERVRLGTLVTGITYRNVAHLAKIVATLDVLSGGRALCVASASAGTPRSTGRTAGLPGDPRPLRAARGRRWQLLPVMWGPGSKPFRGRVLDVPETLCYPRPLQAHVPVVVGGGGERRTLRLAARYADAANVMGGLDVVRRKGEVLRAHCADVGRDPARGRAHSHLSTVLVGRDDRHVAELVEARRPARRSAETYARPSTPAPSPTRSAGSASSPRPAWPR
jgi:alkanesulfonate monooxygenase SsuD/methylene tetrahydromethanopterin reductase-like flavin-dependent oxidoreductase (luciferase family)